MLTTLEIREFTDAERNSNICPPGSAEEFDLAGIHPTKDACPKCGGTMMEIDRFNYLTRTWEKQIICWGAMGSRPVKEHANEILLAA